MEWEKIAEKLRDMIIGEIKEEFKEFRASVTGELSGFRIALESLIARQNSMENEIKELRKAIDETNKRIDELRIELKTEIMKNTERIDETNKRIDETNKRIDDTNKRIDDTNQRIDELYLISSHIRADLNKALSEKKVIDDMLTRIQRLEEKVAI
ncbi:MAG: hypothetical protein ACPLZA_06355 [Thermodesulfovibrio sp.]